MPQIATVPVGIVTIGASYKSFLHALVGRTMQGKFSLPTGVSTVSDGRHEIDAGAKWIVKRSEWKGI